MRHSGRWIAGAPAAWLVVVVGCAADATDAPAARSGPPRAAPPTVATAVVLAEPTSSPAPPATPALPEFGTVAFPGARSVAVAGTASESVVVAYGQDDGLFVTRSEDGGRTFGAAIPATGDTSVHVMPIERPALAAHGADRVGVAWLTIPPDGNGATVWYADSADGGRSFVPGRKVAADDEGETTMVSVALGAHGDPVLSWLNGATLRFARSGDGGRTFGAAQAIGDGACECCQPAVAVADKSVRIAYRSLAAGGDNGFIRDLALIRSVDSGATFEPVTPVSDAHWYLEACPIAGPSLAVRGDDVFVAWMDGRAEPPGTLSRGDVWLAASANGGASFGENVRVNTDATAHHTLPTVGVGPGGRIHVAWQADRAGIRVLYHTTSDDDGRTFEPPRMIASSADGTRGRPNMPTVTVSQHGRVALAWVDERGANVASWMEANESTRR